MNKLPKKPMIKALEKSQDIVEKHFLANEVISNEYLYKFIKDIHFWYILRLGFSNIFRGKEFFKGVNLDSNSKDFLYLHYRYYMSFYELVNFGWCDLKTRLEELEIIFEVKFKTPGDFLDFILISEAYNHIEFEKLPNQQNLYRAYKKLEIGDYKNATKYIEKVEKQTGKLSKRQIKSGNLINYCVKFLQKSKKQRIKSLCKNFVIAEKERIDFIMPKMRKTF
jgi:hypothetical protein